MRESPPSSHYIGMKHPTEDDFEELLLGRMAEPEGLAVLAHVADCEDCRIVYDDVREFVGMVKQALRAEELANRPKMNLRCYSWDSKRRVFVIHSKS